VIAEALYDIGMGVLAGVIIQYCVLAWAWLATKRESVAAEEFAHSARMKAAQLKLEDATRRLHFLLGSSRSDSTGEMALMGKPDPRVTIGTFTYGEGYSSSNDDRARFGVRPQQEPFTWPGPMRDDLEGLRR
jgi:hypothetical protein